MAPPSRRPPAMTARSNGAARGVTRSEETWASPPTESPGKVLSPRIARARAGDREACDETTRGTRPETRTRAPVRQAGVRARRDVWPMWARAEVLRQLACRLPICDKKLQRVFCPYEYRLPGLRPSIFLCFLHTGKQSANTRYECSSQVLTPEAGGEPFSAGESFSLPARRSSQISSRGNGETSRRRAGVSLARASVPRARPRASPDRGSRSARSPFPRPGDRRAVPTSLFGGRALRACASEQRNGGRLRRQSGATPSDRARSLDLTLASRRARHLAHATRVEDAPTQFARRTALLVAPTFRHRRRWKNFARARRRGREGKEIIADEPGQNHG